MTDRLEHRVEEAGMKIQIDIPDELEGHEIHIDTTAVEQMFKEDFAQSKKMTVQGVESKPWWFKMLARAAYLTAPVQ